MQKYIRDLGKYKYKTVGGTETKEILKNVDYNTRRRLKDEAKSLGSNKTSLYKLTKKIGATYGHTISSKFISAVQKRFNKGVDPGIQKRYMKINMQRDELTRGETKRSYASNVITTKSIGVADNKNEKGSMGRIGVSVGPTGFAGGQTNKPTVGINSKP